MQCGTEDLTNIEIAKPIVLADPIKACVAEDYALVITKSGLYGFGNNAQVSIIWHTQNH